MKIISRAAFTARREMFSASQDDKREVDELANNNHVLQGVITDRDFETKSFVGPIEIAKISLRVSQLNCIEKKLCNFSN